MQRVEGVPSDCFFAVRAGHSRRQVLAEANKSLKFPEEVADCTELQVELLTVLGRTTLRLEPGQDHYALELTTAGASFDLSPVKCEVEVRRDSPPCSRQQVPQGPSSGGSVARHERAISAQRYMEQHGLLEAVQTAMEATVKKRPADPIPLMAQLLVEAAAGRKSPAKVAFDSSSETLNRTQAPAMLTARLDDDAGRPSSVSTEVGSPGACRTAVVSPDSMRQETDSVHQDVDMGVAAQEAETMRMPMRVLGQAGPGSYECAATASVGSLSCAEVSISLDHEEQTQQDPSRPLRRNKEVVRLPLLGPALASVADRDTYTQIDTAAESDVAARLALEDHNLRLLDSLAGGGDVSVRESAAIDPCDESVRSLGENTANDVALGRFVGEAGMHLKESLHLCAASQTAGEAPRRSGSHLSSASSVLTSAPGVDDVVVRVSVQPEVVARRRPQGSEPSEASCIASEHSRLGEEAVRRLGEEAVRLDTYQLRPPMAPRPAHHRHGRAPSAAGGASTVSVHSVCADDSDDSRKKSAALEALTWQSMEAIGKHIEKIRLPPDYLRRHAMARSMSNVSEVTAHQFLEEMEPIPERERVVLAHRDVTCQTLRDILRQEGLPWQPQLACGLSAARTAASMAEQRVLAELDRLERVTSSDVAASPAPPGVGASGLRA